MFLFKFMFVFHIYIGHLVNSQKDIIIVSASACPGGPRHQQLSSLVMKLDTVTGWCHHKWRCGNRISVSFVVFKAALFYFWITASIVGPICKLTLPNSLYSSFVYVNLMLSGLSCNWLTDNKARYFLVQTLKMKDLKSKIFIWHCLIYRTMSSDFSGNFLRTPVSKWKVMAGEAIAKRG